MAAHVATAPAADIGWRARTAVTVFCALAPDLDFVAHPFGVRWHQQHTHSVGAALIAGVVVALGARLAGSPRWAGLGLAALIGWLSHVCLDYLNVDTHPPIGIMALWPLSGGFFKFPWPIFMDIGRTLDLHTVRHNVLAVGWEAVALGALLVLCWRRRQHPRR
jgi:membrane-bound metal-dependent hydrolase YbcI (DUF457 family)